MLLEERSELVRREATDEIDVSQVVDVVVHDDVALRRVVHVEIRVAFHRHQRKRPVKAS